MAGNRCRIPLAPLRYVLLAGMAHPAHAQMTCDPCAVGGLGVLDGLSEGDRVVVAGVNRLQAGDEVRLDATGAP